MRYKVLGFNQIIAVEYELDMNDLLILRYFVDLINSKDILAESHEGKKYYWVNYKKLVENLPVLRIKDHIAIRKRFKKLEKFNVLGHYHKKVKGSYSYYCLGENYHYLTDTIIYDEDENYSL